MRTSLLISAAAATVMTLVSGHSLAADNLALGKSVTASSYYNAGSEVFPEAKIVDGITVDSGTGYNWSFWLSAQGTNAGQWVQVDLGTNYQLSSVVLFDTHNRWYNDRGTKDFHLSLSSDGTHFSTIGSGAFTYDQWLNQTALTVTTTDNPIGRYLRFNVGSCWGCQSAGLAELQAYGALPVPEPESYAMLLAGLGLMGFIARRRKTA